MPVPTETTDLCPCGQPVEAQYQRYLPADKYNALPEGLKPIDGYAVEAVKCCWDCHPGPICQHPDATPVPCPVCKAAPGDPCVKADGSPRLGNHRERAAAQPAPVTCRHAHREDCTDPRQCQCGSDDEPPRRAPRVILQPSAQDQAAALGLPPGMLPHALQWLTAHGIDPGKVRGGFRTGLTQDNRPAILFDYPTGADDGHGHEVTETRAVPVE